MQTKPSQAKLALSLAQLSPSLFISLLYLCPQAPILLPTSQIVSNFINRIFSSLTSTEICCHFSQQISLVYWHERWFRKRVSGKLKWPLFSSVNNQFPRSLLFYQKERCYGSEILNACMSNQKKMIYGKKSVTRPPLHIALCYNSR